MPAIRGHLNARSPPARQHWRRGQARRAETQTSQKSPAAIKHDKHPRATATARALGILMEALFQPVPFEAVEKRNGDVATMEAPTKAMPNDFKDCRQIGAHEGQDPQAFWRQE